MANAIVELESFHKSLRDCYLLNRFADAYVQIISDVVKLSEAYNLVVEMAVDLVKKMDQKELERTGSREAQVTTRNTSEDDLSKDIFFASDFSNTGSHHHLHRRNNLMGQVPTPATSSSRLHDRHLSCHGNSASACWIALECNIEEISDEDEPPQKSSKDKKANGPEKGPSLVFRLTSKVPYKTVLKAHSAVVLKAESVADKIEWLNKIRNVVQPSTGGQVKGESSLPVRQSLSDGSLDTMAARRPADPEEELRWMSQEVRGYVEAVLNSLAANVPKAVVLCQVEKAKEDMLNQLYTISSQSTARIEELLQEDQNVKRKRKRYQKQSSLLSKLTRQLSIHDNRTSAASSWANDGNSTESSPRTNGTVSGDDWRSAFDAAANGPTDSRLGASYSRRYSDPVQNGDAKSTSNPSGRRTPNRLPPDPPQSGSAYRY
ncbi:hypothetical protein NL676_016092 [Syzygium grande]|nr:hypothetical protein NL676_016092 [Syzygium grande]